MAKRIAAIYDIHGNDMALEAILAEIEHHQVDLLLIGGDVAWGPEPQLVMNRLLSLQWPACFIRGNADREIAYRYGVEQGLDEVVAEINQWCTDQLSEAQLRFLRQLPESIVLDVEGLGEILFVHGSPQSDDEAIRIDTDEAEVKEMLEGTNQKIVVCGHTHVQFDRRIGSTRVINPGSAGLPSRATGAFWALLGPDVSLKETKYDVEAAAARIRLSGVPYAEEFARHILFPPDNGP